MERSQISLIMKIITIMTAYMLLTMTIPFGKSILYPFNLFVTFLHEFGHALLNVITGGTVKSLQINTDGSGVTTTMGGSRALTIAGGYLGSIFFGNLFIYFSTKGQLVRQILLFLLIGGMIVSNIFWFSTITNFIIIGIFLVAVYYASKSQLSSIILLVMGVISVMNILTDFIGPSSDVAQFNSLYPIGTGVWMILWTASASIITFFTVKSAIKEVV